jgi:phosphohistidine phosphatase SixA
MGSGSSSAIRQVGRENAVLFLVRHAERADEAPGATRESDPNLSAIGHERAALLAEMLEDVGLTQILSSDRIRTRETAAPTAAATGLEVSLYDVDDIAGLAARLKAARGRQLVVGHSNTTWDLVEALGGDPGPPIGSLEYDRLYMIILDPDGVRTVLLRFGRLFEG